jgi:hypothetical protein
MIIGNKGLGRDCIVSCLCGSSSSYAVHLCPAPSSSFKQYIGRPPEFLIPNVWKPLRHKTTVRYLYVPCCFNILHFNLKHLLSHISIPNIFFLIFQSLDVERWERVTGKYLRDRKSLDDHFQISTSLRQRRLPFAIPSHVFNRFSHTRGSIRGREWKTMHDMPSNIWICSWKWKLMKRHKLELFL